MKQVGGGLMDFRPGTILTVTGIIALVVVLMPSRPNRHCP